jgi:PilZ domain
MTAFDDARGSSRGTTNWDRRRGQRAEVLWKGNYLVVDPFTSLAWQRCYLVDLSESGAAIEIHGDDLEVGQRILIRLDPHPTYHDSWLQLRAMVVNCRVRPNTVCSGWRSPGSSRHSATTSCRSP